MFLQYQVLPLSAAAATPGNLPASGPAASRTGANGPGTCAVSFLCPASGSYPGQLMTGHKQQAGASDRLRAGSPNIKCSQVPNVH